jgi:hypothetical protein
LRWSSLLDGPGSYGVNSNALLKQLTDASVEFVVVGGLAATIHGSAYVTLDADICIPFEPGNIARVLQALSPIHAVNRMRPDRPPLGLRVEDYAGFKNLYVLTDLGQLDLLGNIVGVGGYADCLRESHAIDIDDVTVRVLGVEALIRCKRALARTKDLLVARELALLHKVPDMPSGALIGDEANACRVCGLMNADAPWGLDDASPRFEFCPCCGVESGYQDSQPESARKFREHWVAAGAKWDEPDCRPRGWNLEVQLGQVPRKFR